ncbi:MAG: hypothetical protein KJ709_02675 [Nanoarchaeota archaeon]|nr:hypothetical protein [Nanoarchaeota archaeon]
MQQRQQKPDAQWYESQKYLIRHAHRSPRAKQQTIERASGLHDAMRPSWRRDLLPASGQSRPDPVLSGLHNEFYELENSSMPPAEKQRRQQDVYNKILDYYAQHPEERPGNRRGIQWPAISGEMFFQGPEAGAGDKKTKPEGNDISDVVDGEEHV